MKSESLTIRLTPEALKTLKKLAIRNNRRTGELARIVIENFLGDKLLTKKLLAVKI